jgi:radical SAM superfamily enzyme YgiQ (UPF0313 family)
MSLDILLVQPPYHGQYNFWKSECLGMGYLAAALEKRGYKVHILDAFLLDMDIESVVQHIRNNPPRLLLGFSILSYELYRTGDLILRRIRTEGFNVHVTVGSWFPTFWYRTMIADGFAANSIIMGEGERSICALADYLNTGNWAADSSFLKCEQIEDTLVVHQESTLPDIDSLPYPRRDYLSESLKRYNFATVYTARGCSHSQCTFCSVPKFYKGGAKHRLRSPENVIGEIENLAHLGADFVLFVDEDFIGNSPENSKRAIQIFEGVAERGISMRYAFNCTTRGVDKELFKRLAELGLASVYIGLESNLERVLKLFSKGVRSADVDRAICILRDLNIKVVPAWIMFERNTTLDEVESQIKFLMELNAYHVNYLKALYVMKDTPIEKIYGDDVYHTFYDKRYFFKDPDVDLLVRILFTEYLPETMPYTNGIYPVWHKILAGTSTDEQQCRYEAINAQMKNLSLEFTSELIRRIKSRSLDGLAQTLTENVHEWQKIGVEIDELGRRKL